MSSAWPPEVEHAAYMLSLNLVSVGVDSGCLHPTLSSAHKRTRIHMGDEEFTWIIGSSIQDSVPGLSGQKRRLPPALQPQPRAKRKECTSAICLLVLALS